MASKKTIPFFIATFLLVVAGCYSKKQEPAAGAAKPAAAPAGVEGFVVSATGVAEDIEVPGSIAPFEVTELHPEISGKVTGLYFEEGRMVNQGSLLVKLYDADLKAQLNKLQVQLAIAQKTEQRQNELLKINGISQQDYDVSLLSVRNLQADIEILKTSIAKTSITAPFSGKLGLRNISLGAYITPATIIGTIRQVNQLKLVFTVPEKYSSKMKEGMQITFSAEGHATRYRARILATENDIASETRSLMVKAVVQDSDPGLFAGTFAKVQINLGRNETALMVPSQSIIPQARGKKVMMVLGGKAVLQDVTTGLRDSAMVEITQGLKPGDTILTTGLLTTKPGNPVKMNPIKK